MTENLPAPRSSGLSDPGIDDLIIRVACLALLLAWSVLIIRPFLPIMA